MILLYRTLVRCAQDDSLCELSTEPNGFTKKYNLTKLVYFETTTDITAAIYREKQLKGLLRSKKITLVEENNPEWDDLSAQWNLLEDPSLRSG